MAGTSRVLAVALVRMHVKIQREMDGNSRRAGRIMEMVQERERGGSVRVVGTRTGDEGECSVLTLLKSLALRTNEMGDKGTALHCALLCLQVSSILASLFLLFPLPPLRYVRAAATAHLLSGHDEKEMHCTEKRSRVTSSWCFNNLRDGRNPKALSPSPAQSLMS